MKKAFDNLIVIGRPACGKSEFFDFIKNRVGSEERQEKFFIAPFVELDDFVWLWDKCMEDDLWERLGCERVVSKRSGHAYLVTNWKLYDFLIEKINREAARTAADGFYKDGTLLIEFARGTKDAYRNALNRLSKEILERAAVFYIKVSFEESMRRNDARYQEKLKHSILAHKVPDEEMREYYHADDWEDITGGKESGHLALRGVNVPFVTMMNEPESKDLKVLAGRYEAALGRLWQLKR